MPTSPNVTWLGLGSSLLRQQQGRVYPKTHIFVVLRFNIVMLGCFWFRNVSKPLLLQQFIWTSNKENIKARKTDTMWGNSIVTGGFPSQSASDAEGFSGHMTSSWKNYPYSDSNVSLIVYKIVINRIILTTNPPMSSSSLGHIGSKMRFLTSSCFCFQNAWWRHQMETFPVLLVTWCFLWSASE